ncbi:pseudouridine synthase [Proteinivorax hydrogeniformans]|uniref:Pseudouridine synthase n=1 Tax=Proteinivorax hydrogeniformans TaxID=1826727 RepID=A0AAU8HR80_9FIRM
MERLQKVMANYGVASRRKCEKIIEEGRVKVNGVIITEMGIKVSPEDKIEVDGQLISGRPKQKYYLLNKPVGYVTTADDPQGRKTVLDLISKNERVFPVGRLDIMTSGLLLITNDGDLAFKLTHPSFTVEKTYKVTINKDMEEKEVDLLEKGVPLEDGMTAPAKAHKAKSSKGSCEIILTIHEGKNRQVRRMISYFGYKVISLERIKYSFLNLDGVKVGNYRELHREEIAKLYNLAKKIT